MRPSYLYQQHSHPPHHYHPHPHQQQQPAHQMPRPNPASNGHINTPNQRSGLEGLGSRPGSAGAPSGLIDLSCSGPRFQHHYQMQAASASDVSGKVYRTPERDVRCQNVAGSRTSIHRGNVSDLRLMVATPPTDNALQVCLLYTSPSPRDS